MTFNGAVLIAVLLIAIIVALWLPLLVRYIRHRRAIRRRLDEISVTWRKGGLAARSLCCGATCQPLGWSQDGWIASCRQCGTWQYLGEDHDNPPPGFRIDGKPEGFVAGGHIFAMEKDGVRTEVTSAKYHRDWGGQAGDLEYEMTIQRPGERLVVSADHVRCELPPRADPYGQVQDDGTISWREGYALTHGIVAIPLDQRDKAEEHGWRFKATSGESRVHMERTQEEHIANLRRLEAIPGYIGRTAGDTPWDSEQPYYPVGKSQAAARIARAFGDEGEPLKTPPMPNIGGEGHPDYQGPHYNTPHDRFVPYDMLHDPIPGTAVHQGVNGAGCAGPLATERNDDGPDADNR